MRLISAMSTVVLLTLAFVIPGSGPATTAKPLDGQAIFRFDTFGDEQLWTDVLRMHEVVCDG